MAQFRKKPVVIEAVEFRLGFTPYPEGVVPVVYRENDEGEVTVLGSYKPEDEYRIPDSANVGFGIKTLEGWHHVTHGDWIITGVKGERYPCKPDIFAQTYDPV